MNSFRVYSDIHLEFLDDKALGIFIKKSVMIQKENRVDYLILAGDICSLDTCGRLKLFFESVYGLYKNIFYVVGNHEFYSRNIFDLASFQNRNREYYEYVIKTIDDICSKFENVIFLNNSACEIKDGVEGIIIYGTPLWTDMDLNTYNVMNDRLTLKYETIMSEFEKSVEKIKKFLIDIESRKANQKFIIISHHLPLMELIDEKYRKDIIYSKYNSGFASDIGKEIIEKYKIDYWVYGHTHLRSIKNIEECCFVCNPYGYPTENGHYKAGKDIDFFKNYDFVFRL